MNVKQMFHKVFWVLSVSSLFQILLGAWQYFNQKSLGLKILGEEYIRPYLSGIAKFKIPGGIRWSLEELAGVSRETDFVMRPYGTFPHPNVFGAFLVAVSIITIYLLLVSRETWKKWLLSLILFGQIFGLSLSYSRVAIASWIIAFLVWLAVFNMKQIKKKFQLTAEEKQGMRKVIILVFVSGIICLALFYPLYLERAGIVSYGTTNQQAISERGLYQKIALQMIVRKPLTGVGFQNFVLSMDQYSPWVLKPGEHQPVHNIYLLVAAETGILGFAVFILFLGFIANTVWRKGLNKISATLFTILSAFLFIGFFDHYLLTIQQGRLLFFLVAGLLVASVSVNEEEMSSAAELG